MREILCKLFGHRRSRRQARPVGGLWRSSCRFCGSEMIRTRPGQWMAVALRDLPDQVSHPGE